MNRSPKRTDWERTVYSKKRSTCAWWACDIMNGTFVESRKYIMSSYSGLCQRKRVHCNLTTSCCSLFFLVLWTSIYHYLIQKLIQILNVALQNNREMIVANRSIWVFHRAYVIFFRFINISLCYHKLELKNLGYTGKTLPISWAWKTHFLVPKPEVRLCAWSLQCKTNWNEVFCLYYRESYVNEKPSFYCGKGGPWRQ